MLAPQPNRAWVWSDDEVRPEVTVDLLSRHPNGLLVATDPVTGITDDDVAAVNVFLKRSRSSDIGAATTKALHRWRPASNTLDDT